MKVINLYLLLFVCILPLAAKDLYFQNLDLNNGFTQPSAISIYQDDRGYIYFGNDNFNIYDGKVIRTFRLSSYIEKVEDNHIHAICGDGKSTVYMLANRMLVTYNMKTEVFHHTNLLAHALTYLDNRLFYANQHQFYQYTSDSHSELICTLPDSTLVIQCMYRVDSDWLLGTTKGLYRYANGSFECLLDNKSISCLFVDERKRLWVGTAASGVGLLEGDKWSFFKERNSAYPLVNDQVRCINQDSHDNIWIGTFGGLTIVPPSLDDCFHLSHKERVPWSLQHSSVYAIHRDSQGGMWVGTYYGGLSYFNPNTESYQFYGSSSTDPKGLTGFLFGKMVEDNKGNLYISTEHGGLNCINRNTGQITNFNVNSSALPCRTTKTVWYDEKRDRLYIGTFLHGLLCYSSGRFERIGIEVLQKNNQKIVTDLIPWKDKLIVVSQGGIFLMDLVTREFTPLFSDEKLCRETNVAIRSIYLDIWNRLWISPANREVLCVNMDTRKLEIPSSVKEVIGKRFVQNISGDKQGKLYFIVKGVGIWQYEPTTEDWVCFNQEQGHLLTNESFRTMVTPLGKLLVTSIQGITLLDVQTGKSMHTQLGSFSPLHRLNANCGIYISPIDSVIFIGGVEGFIETKEADLEVKEAPYTLSFNSLSINNVDIFPSSESKILQKGIAYTSQLTLPYEQNSITIGFTSTNYRYADKNLFEYKLEGLDKQWTRTRHQQIVYTSLSPGNYRLLVREVDGGKQITMDIRIRPPFYASLYAIGLYGVLTVLLLIWLIRFNRSRAVLKTSLELEQREKLRIEKLNQMKLKFYINISHELRTPLTLMTSQIDLILQNNDLGRTFHNKLLKVRRYTVQMQQLITEVLDFRRLEQGKMPLHASQQNLVAFMRQIFDSFKDYAVTNRIQYGFEGIDEEISVWFDPVQIRKVFNNLISNAFKFTPKNGSITVNILRKKEIVEIRISDTGSGIPQSQLVHIFERFYQADNATGVSLSGSGIGLALTHEIILQHKGEIKVESKLGEGTTFTVTLRLGDEHFTTEQKLTERQSINIQPIQHEVIQEVVERENQLDNQLPDMEEGEKSLSVLLVEDNEDLQQVLEEAFSIRYKVYKAGNGEEGIRMAELVQPDLIISDVMMPGINGIVMCQRLKRKLETSHIPIILLTARIDLESTLEGLKCGASDYIMKPFNMELLLLKCNNIVATLHRQQANFHTEAEAAPTELATNRLDQQLLEESIRIIETNLSNKDFDIDMWCREIAVGRTRLNTKIKAITGLTLNDFIIQIRLRKCASLLEKTDLTISEICWQVGFSSPSYLGKSFKNYFDVTPLQYRKAKREK